MKMSHSAVIATRDDMAEARRRPLFTLRARTGGGGLELEIWQLPSPATPRLTSPELTASLKGRTLELVEMRVMRRLRERGIRLSRLRGDEAASFDLDEDLALQLALLFRALAPMRSLERIRETAEGIDRMTREEAGYWLGMAIHRKNPRRVLAALRMLLTTP
jgi:hypothetical protein